MRNTVFEACSHTLSIGLSPRSSGRLPEVSSAVCVASGQQTSCHRNEFGSFWYTWRRALLLSTHNRSGLVRVHQKNVLVVGAWCHFSGRLYISLNARDTHKLPLRHRALELALCVQHCVVDVCVDAAFSGLMSNTYSCTTSGYNMNRKQNLET